MKIEEVEYFLSRIPNEPQKVISVGFVKKDEGVLIATYKYLMILWTFWNGRMNFWFLIMGRWKGYWGSGEGNEG